MPVTGSKLSVQVSLSGFCFRISGEGNTSSGWLGAEKLFTTKEFQLPYDEVEVSLLTPKVALIPELFYDASEARNALSEVSVVKDADRIGSLEVPQYSAVLVYSNSINESLSRVISQSVYRKDGSSVEVLPEMYYILRELSGAREYNRIVASFRDGYLYLAIAQGNNLKLCNVFEATDFTTAEYFIFLSLKNLQLNPEVSTISFRTPLSDEERMSLYRYFKAVEEV